MPPHPPPPSPLPHRPLPTGELKLVGIKNPEAIARPSVRNDAAFLFSVVASSSLLAVVLGQLPGDWGWFGSYLAGGVAFVPLVIGGLAPSGLAWIIEQFSQVCEWAVGCAQPPKLWGRLGQQRCLLSC